MAALLHHNAGRLPTAANYLLPHPRSPQGDSHVVNCLSPHPSHTFVLATSGIDDDIKVWAPSRAERAPPGDEAEDLMRDNLRRQGHPRRQMLVTPEMLQARRPAAPRGAGLVQPAGCWARCWQSPQPVSTKRRLPCMQMLLAGRLGVRVTRGAGGNLGGSGSDEEEMLVDVGSEEEEEEEEAAQEQQQQGSRRGTRRRRRLAPDDCTVM